LREQFGFEEWDAVEAPGGVGDFVGELRLGGRSGGVLIYKLLDVALVSVGVLGSHSRGSLECEALGLGVGGWGLGIGDWGLGIGVGIGFVIDYLGDVLRRSLITGDGDFAHLGHRINTGVDAAQGRVGMVC
jgi:hypothetical protein